jgi:hypothetical protein
MHRALPIVALLLIAAAPSGPHDPDLAIGKTCSGHPSADKLVAALPTYAKELVVLWPRAGKTERDGTCVSVARLTIINHQGVIMTLSLGLHAGDSAPQPGDYDVINDDTMPRAVLELASSEPKLLIQMAGAPSTSREALESTLEFVPLDDVVEAIIPPTR